MKLRRILPLAGVSSLALATALYAQDNQNAETVVLNPITLVADGQENVEATGGVSVTPEDIEALQPADVSELFARESSITVSGGGGPAKKVSVFGIEQSLLAVTVDGVPQAQTSWHHTGSNVIDPAFLKSVEVEAGAAAADSGFAAAAGALRYETVGALDLLEAGQNVGGRAALSYGSNGRGFSGSLAGYGRSGGFDWFIMAHGSNGDNYDNGDGKEVLGTEPAARNVLAKLGYEFEGHRIELGLERSRDEADRLIKANMGLAGDEVHPLKVSRDTVKLTYTSTEPTDMWDPEVSLYFSQYEYWRPNYLTLRRDENGDPTYVSANNGNAIFEEEQFGGKVQNTFTINTGKITAGVDFNQHDYATDNYGAGNNNRRYRNFSTSQIGVFAQGRFEFQNGFSLSTGARYDAHRFTDWNGERFSDSGASVNGTLAYRVNDSIEVFAGASRTWLGYVIGDYGYVHARSNAFVTDPNLDTGTAKNLKVGANFNGDAWQAGITVFDTKIDGLLSYESSTLLTNRTEEYRSKGVTLHGTYDFGNTRIGASFTKADVTGDGDDVLPNNGVYFMPVGETATLWVDHELPAWNTVLGASVEWAGSIDERVTSTTTYYKQPSYTVVNAYAEWTPQAYENVAVRLSVDNLFDKNYYERSGYAANDRNGGIEPVWAPGRTITLGTTMKF
ncbi:TonB-dependent receptor domain-containing protein [Paracoccus sp. P2]|uniref:TonB-dependent receptor n=2 Tax=Paracoccus pantotrophus TaxID=82367 RepID=A0A7H9BSK3_PARPN|nr:TonB-dependent receptor [Paracoccus pantotrophus]MDF3852807.1 TonB-dependent receptor [Paracoccus pantotrophus]QLH14314.1 TonB-dependent receptor [Paracoccus pantotrophus]RDD98101.1 TonB-dependent receptor [Paracoccus pantotrophus]RNI18527.1 TonB-dependent receptor [Paracoccus pantotrophus]WGR64446.1 TonB-dependent receptor [Paracoccus pantotrophus]